MIDMTFWMRAAITVLVAVPPVIFVLFLRDAAALLRDLRVPPAEPPASGQGVGAGSYDA